MFFQQTCKKNFKKFQFLLILDKPLCYIIKHFYYYKYRSYCKHAFKTYPLKRPYIPYEIFWTHFFILYILNKNAFKTYRLKHQRILGFFSAYPTTWRFASSKPTNWRFWTNVHIKINSLLKDNFFYQ